jgi:serine/threonine protein kinase
MAILEPGQDFGAYRLVSSLSRGGMGEVWRALKLGPSGSDWSRQVALKVILPTLSDNKRFTDMFLSEARLAAGLAHANIVGVSDFGREGQVFWLEQELIDGQDLARLLERTSSGFPLHLGLFVVIEAMKGLAYAHNHSLPDGRAQTVIHRDIKPANVLVAREGHVKLTDFGIAKALSGSNPSITELKGTIGYIAPELLQGQAPSARSDLFAMGLIFWELLTGRKLFDGDNEAAKLMKTFECVVPKLAEMGIGAPPGIEVILRRLLAREPSARYASADEALTDLLNAPSARQATSLDLKAFLTNIGVSSLPAISASVATMAGKRWSTGTLAGQVSRSFPARLNRFFGRRPVLITMFLLAAASVTAALTIHPSPPAVTPIAVAPAAAAPARPDAAVPVVAAPAPPPPVAPKRSVVHVDVKPADARVSVDGHSLEGDSPHVVEAEPGATLAFHVERSGYEANDRQVRVDSDEMTVPIELRAETRNISRGRPKPSGKEVVMPPKEARPAPSKPEPKRDKDQILMPEDN